MAAKRSQVTSVDVLTMGSLVFALLLAWLPVLGALLASLALMPGLTRWDQQFGAYSDLWHRNQMKEFWLIVQRSLLVSGIATLFALGTVATFGGAKQRNKTLAIGLVVIPLVIPDTIRAFSWSQLLAPDGFVGRLIPGISSTTASFVGLLSVSVVPLVFAAFVYALPSPGSTCWLSAAETPKHPWIQFWRLILLAVVHVLLFAFVAGFVFALNASAEEQYLGPTSTSMQKVASGLVNIDPSLLGAFGIVLFGGIGALALITAGVLHINPLTALLWKRSVPRYVSSAVRYIEKLLKVVVPILSATALMTTLIVLWLPMFTLARLSLGAESSRVFPTLHFFFGALRSSELWEALLNSLAVATISSGVASVIGIYAGRIAWWKYGQFLMALVLLPAVLPADVHALSVQQLVRLAGINRSGLPLVVVCHASWLLPFILTAAVFAYGRIDPALLYAAREFGHRETVVFRKVIFPMVRGPVLTASLAAGLLSFTEFRRGWHLAGAAPLLSTKVFGALESGVVGEGPSVYVAALVASMIGILGCVLVGKLARERV